MSWQCPYRCKWRECIHVAAERVRLVCAVWEAAEGVIDAVRERTKRAQALDVREPLERYDAAVQAQKDGP